MTGKKVSDGADRDDIGYGKPPKAYQFKPGQSGNPKGRPKGSKNRRPKNFLEQFEDTVLSEWHRKTEISENGHKVSIEVSALMLRALNARAIKGDVKASQLAIGLAKETIEAKDLRHEEAVTKIMDYKLAWSDWINAAKAQGETVEAPIPHPDNIYIDMETGAVSIVGPLTEDEARRLALVERIADHHRSSLETALLRRRRLRAKDRIQEADANIQLLQSKLEEFETEIRNLKSVKICRS